MLLKLTNVFKDGSSKPVLVNSDVVKDVQVDSREEFGSNSILVTKDERFYYVKETVEEIGGMLG